MLIRLSYFQFINIEIIILKMKNTKIKLLLYDKIYGHCFGKNI